MSTIRPRALERRYRSAALAVGLGLLAWCARAPEARASERVEIELLPAGEALFLADVIEPTVAPAEGEVVVIGRITEATFSVASIDQLAVTAPGGRVVPLLIEEASLFKEFGRIASPLRFAFHVREEEARDDAAGFTLAWGPDVRGPNRLVPRIVPDAAVRARYRTFRPRAPVRSEFSQEYTVIADSAVEYHFLWYLLPMAVLLALLTLRKIRARDPVDAAPS